MKSAEDLKNEEARFANLVNRNYDDGRGNILRLTVRKVASAYKDRIDDLEPYMKSEDEKVAGIATSAYHLLTGYIVPIQSKNYGGLGAIIDGNCEYVMGETNPENGIGMLFDSNQLHFAKLSGNALRDSRNIGNAFFGIDISGRALWGSENQINVMRNIAKAGFESHERGNIIDTGPNEVGNERSIFKTSERSFGYYTV